MSLRGRVGLPADLIEQVDRGAGKLQRSRFVEEAVRKKLAREAQKATLEAGAGILSKEDYPEWSTPEDISRWVSELRGHGARRPDERPSP